MVLSAEIEAALEHCLDAIPPARRERVVLLAIADIVALHQGRPAVNTSAPDLGLPLRTTSRSDVDAIGAELDWMGQAGDRARRQYLQRVTERAELYARSSAEVGENTLTLSTPGQRRHLTAILEDLDPSVQPAATAEFLRRYQSLFPITLAGMTAREHRGELDSILRKGTARDLNSFLDKHSIDAGDVDERVACRLASLSASVLHPVLHSGPGSLIPPVAEAPAPPAPPAPRSSTSPALAPSAPSTTEEVVRALVDLGFRRVDDDSEIPYLWTEAMPDPDLGTVLETDAPITVFARVVDGWLELFSPVADAPTPPQHVAAHEICAVRRGVGLRMVASDFLCVTVSLPFPAVLPDAIDTVVSAIVDTVMLVALAVPAPADPGEVVP